MTRLHGIFLLILTLTLAATGLQAAERGQLTGGKVHDAPGWFKDSFLEIADDAEEAGDEDKHLILFFQTKGCPYCDKMLTESFEPEPMTSFIQEHFDVISLSTNGFRDVAFNEEISVTEMELAEHLNVRATPAVIFLNSDNEQIARVNGYRAPERFKTILDYIQTKAYLESSLQAYLENNLEKDIYVLRDNRHFKDITDLSAVKGPMLLIFEDSACNDCNKFHDRLLSREEVDEVLGKFTVVRLDTDSNQMITDVDGSKKTALQLARQFEMSYRPGVLVYDNGEQMRRYDSLLYSHHFRMGLNFIADKAYEWEDYRTYSERIVEETLAAGQDISFSEPDPE